MTSDAFYTNGAMLTMPDGYTYSAQNLSAVEPVVSAFDSPPAEESYFINPLYDLSQLRRVYRPLQISVLSKLGDETHKSQSHLGSKSAQMEWSTDWSEYKKTYDAFQKVIGSKELTKAVPFATFTAPRPENFNENYLPFIINKLLSDKNEEQFLYGQWDLDEGFLGLTPEILFEKKTSSSSYQSMALAGTLPANVGESMREDSKLMEEHQLVIDDISEKLQGHQLLWGETQEKVYGSMKHLYSPVSFDSSWGLKDLVAKLSPTSAVGTYPSNAWVNYVEWLKSSTRGAYGAPFGLIMPNQLRVVVCLRGIFWNKKTLSIHVGGGITSKSDYQTEVNELKLKFESTRTKLGL